MGLSLQFKKKKKKIDATDLKKNTRIVECEKAHVFANVTSYQPYSEI